MKTLADLKRDAKSGILEAKMVVRCGSDDIPDNLMNWRKIVSSNTVCLFFMRNDGRISELRLPNASLIEYDGESLVVYYPGFRELNAEEQRVMNGWQEYSQRPAFIAQMEADALSEGTSTYWSEVAYFSKAGFEYLMGSKKQKGLKYDRNTKQIQDDKIKGKICMRYEIRKIA